LVFSYDTKDGAEARSRDEKIMTFSRKDVAELWQGKMNHRDTETQRRREREDFLIREAGLIFC
jgi:hypothetical protein